MYTRLYDKNREFFKYGEKLDSLDLELLNDHEEGLLDMCISVFEQNHNNPIEEEDGVYYEYFENKEWGIRIRRPIKLYVADLDTDGLYNLFDELLSEFSSIINYPKTENDIHDKLIRLTDSVTKVRDEIF